MIYSGFCNTFDFSEHVKNSTVSLPLKYILGLFCWICDGNSGNWALSLQSNSMASGLGVTRQPSNAHFRKNNYEKPDKNKLPFSKECMKYKKKKNRFPLEQKDITRAIRQNLNQIFNLGSILMMVVLQFGLAVLSSCIPVGNIIQPDPTQALSCQRSFKSGYFQHSPLPDLEIQIKILQKVLLATKRLVPVWHRVGHWGRNEFA